MEFIDVKDYTLALGAAEATGPLKGTTKRGDVKSSQGEKLTACQRASGGVICGITLFSLLL